MKKIRIQKTRIRDPDYVEIGLIGVLVIWSISAFMLLQQAANISLNGGLLSWTSLTTFFVGVMSVILIVIAVILADIRKELIR
jgi:hypothetical protein